MITRNHIKKSMISCYRGKINYNFKWNDAGILAY